MSPEEKLAMFRASAIVAAHAKLVANAAEGWSEPDLLVAQVELLRAAVEDYAKLPRPQPQQKAA